MKKGTFFLLLLAVLAVVAYLTNPSEEQHKEAARRKLDTIVESSLERYGVTNKLLSVFGVDAASKFADQLIGQNISARNYYIFSLTNLKWEEKNYVIGVGAFGKVYIFRQVDELAHTAIDDFLKKKIQDLIPGIDNIFK